METSLSKAEIDTPLGSMLAIADEQALYLLSFIDPQGLQKEIVQLQKQTKKAIIPGYTQPIHQIKKELNLYFEKKLQEFKTPLLFIGSPFQRSVWEELKKIPFGKTRSYLEMAIAISNPSAFRAVAQANGANRFVITA
jgi:AraC family transcriptional regulator of adaptative response/methylated-DNA-[protein]-cysteine methyltransferase